MLLSEVLLSSVLIVFVSAEKLNCLRDVSNLDEPSSIRVAVDERSVIEDLLVNFENFSGNRGINISYSFNRLNVTKRLACYDLIAYLRKVNEYEVSELALSVICNAYISIIPIVTEPFIGS